MSKLEYKTKKIRNPIFIALGSLTLMAALFLNAAADNKNSIRPFTRPTTWAIPIKLDGVPNLYKVSDDLYRSAQPTAEGMKNLKKIGIETIVNLRSFHSDRDEIGSTGLAYEHLYTKPWHPEEKEVVRFLQIVTNPKRTPVLVHCQVGADRTGTMCALYRIAVQGWTKEEAINEMTEGGFGYHKTWRNLVQYVMNLDMKDIKEKSGLKTGR